MKATHTPGPWKVDVWTGTVEGFSAHTGKHAAVRVDTDLVCPTGLLDNPVSLADAEFIVLACNAYDDLLAACKAWDDFGRALLDDMEQDDPMRVLSHHFHKARIDMTRSAIAKAEGGKP